ncbi:MAG: cyclophilin-like fold protein [Eubacteriales bacterium]|nr:cyclophilin-like fold protein [Eubacteriales bacterium]
MKKKLLSCLTALSVLFEIGVPALAVDTGFADVPQDAYYAAAVRYCRDTGLISGTSDTTFSPHDATFRAQLTAMLWRQAGSPAAGGEPFADVSGAAYYAEAAAWANEQGVVTGYGDGRFGPNDPVTRAQLTAILWRVDGRPTAAETTPFADQTAIPSYAADAAAWACAGGIVSGKDGGRFDPNGRATRAETAAILCRWLTGGAPNEGPDRQDDPAILPKLTVEIGNQAFPVTLEDNETTRALLDRLPLTVTLSELNGNEKYYYLPDSLPANAARPGTIRAGDLMLYGDDCLVLFYQTFDSGYSYTRLGALDAPAGLPAAVGRGSVEATFRVR